MDIAKTIAEFLAPFLPYLILASKAAAEEAGKKFGEAAWNKATTVWEKLKPKVKEKPLLKEATEKVARKPKDARVIGNLEVELEDVFEQDSSFAQTLHSIVIGGDVEKATIFNNSDENQSVNNNTGNVTQSKTYIYNPPQSDSETEKINKARDNYLRDLIIFCNLLPLTALGDKKRVAELITLENVYINLDTDKVKEDEDGKEAKSRKNEIELEREEKNLISCMEVAVKEDRLVLLGNAGSGKSSFVKNLIAKQASVLRDGKPALKGFAPDLIPVYIELRKLSPRLKDLNIENLSRQDKLKKLSDLVFEQLKHEAQERNASDFLPKIEDAFNEGKILFVFDGLDEVPQKLRELVRLTVEAIIQLQKIKKIIITSRLNAYTEQNVFHNFKDYKIAPLDEEKIESFAEEWYKAQLAIQKINEDEAKEKTEDLARRAIRDVPREMSGNPMMLTCIAIIHKSGKRFPEHRAVLYNQLVELLSNRWQEEKAGSIADAELAEVLKDKKLLRKAIEGLAYETHRSNYEAGGDTEEADLSYGQAFDLLRQPEYFGDARVAAEFLDYIYQQSGLFNSDGGEQTSYRFPHRQIQEYLAGCYLIDQDNSEELYKTHAMQGDFWSATALLGAEEIIQNQNKAWKNLLHIIYELCPSQISETEGAERAILWSGQIAVEFGIDEIQQKSAQAKDYLTRLTTNTLYLLEKSKFLTPRERAEAGNTLSQLGDPRFGVIPHPQPLSQERERGVNLLFCEIRAGKFLMGSTKADKLSNESEYPQFEYNIPNKFFMSRYPVTNAQFEAFEKDEDGYTQAKWWTEAGLEWRKDRKEHYRYSGVFALANHPVVGVTWYETNAFCKWATEQLQVEGDRLQVWKDGKVETIDLETNKYEICLPSEAEWERAARGISLTPNPSPKSGRGEQLFPWGDEITPNHANYSATNLNGTSAVGAFPLGMNKEFGLLDMSGNVWEWCATAWQEDYKDYLKKENNEVEGEVARVLRGGSYFNVDWNVRCAGRDWYYPFNVYLNIGFRVVCVPSPISP